jgi:hypothetical protein
VIAEGTFIHIPIGVGITGIIRARSYAGSATDTLPGIDQHYTPFGKVTGPGRAATHAGGIITMVTSFRTYFYLKHGIGAICYFHHPFPAVSDGNVIFGLAGHHAVAAAYAFFCINSHGISHDAASFSAF